MLVKVLIIDSSDIVRAGLCEVIEAASHIEVVGQTGSRVEAQDLAAKLRPHVVILDLGPEQSNWQETVFSIRRLSPESRLLIFTSKDCSEAAQLLISAGADGYIVKEASSNEIVAAIKAVAAGRMILSITEMREIFSDDDAPTPERQIASPNGTGPSMQLIQKLSEREVEVLTCIARGKTNQQIADDMYLSVKTIETYRSRLAKKIGAKSRADLFEFASSAGMLV